MRDPSAPKKPWILTIIKRTVFSIALFLVIYVIFWMPKSSQETLTGGPGVIQDGVFYTYRSSEFVRTRSDLSWKANLIFGDSGSASSERVKIPIGLCTYTPGRETEVLLSVTDYSLDTDLPTWGVNERGLYFADKYTGSLYHMDLDTRELTILYALPGEAYQTAFHISALYLFEDHIILQRSADQVHDYLTLDCETGNVLSQSKEPPPELSEPQPGTAAYEVQRLGLPAQQEDVTYSYLDVADQWLFYTAHTPKFPAEIKQSITELWVMDVETQERYLVQEDVDFQSGVTDGTWLYSYENYTNCYQLEYNGQGIPCGLTLVEDSI